MSLSTLQNVNGWPSTSSKRDTSLCNEGNMDQAGRGLRCGFPCVMAGGNVDVKKGKFEFLVTKVLCDVVG
jgi:hypothetical protein